MKIRMLQTRKGSTDGINVTEFEQGKKYDIPGELGQTILREGWGEEDKDMGSAPEKKSVPVVPAPRTKRVK